MGHAVGDQAVDMMIWYDFVTRFRDEFAPVIEVQQLAREFQDPHQTTKIVVEITMMLKRGYFWFRSMWKMRR